MRFSLACTPRDAWRRAAPLAVAAGLGGCAAAPSPLQHEDFSASATYTRSFAASDAQSCEAARRALLSQGYVVSTARADLVEGRKSFQQQETHLEVQFRVVCAPEGNGGKRTLAFVNAVQDRYALKKSNNSASVGVGAFGSLSLPFTSSDDSMVKVASETVTNGAFYERFFGLLQRYLVLDQILVQPAAEPQLTAAEPPPADGSASLPAR